MLFVHCYAPQRYSTRLKSTGAHGYFMSNCGRGQIIIMTSNPHWDLCRPFHPLQNIHAHIIYTSLVQLLFREANSPPYTARVAVLARFHAATARPAAAAHVDFRVPSPPSATCIRRFSAAHVSLLSEAVQCFTRFRLKRRAD